MNTSSAFINSCSQCGTRTQPGIPGPVALNKSCLMGVKCVKNRGRVFKCHDSSQNVGTRHSSQVGLAPQRCHQTCVGQVLRLSNSISEVLNSDVITLHAYAAILTCPQIKPTHLHWNWRFAAEKVIHSPTATEVTSTLRIHACGRQVKGLECSRAIHHCIN